MAPEKERDVPSRVRAIRKKLLLWFDAHARDLPWRRTRDPYAVYLSEIMLQQTRVDTVIPYFERFVARFPTVVDLANAPIDDVLGLWSGLGYYRRARSLHLAAREVTERHDGRFPSDRESLEALPGIGAYTAGAIASIAFEKEEAIVDGNVARVLSRLFAVEAQIGSKESTKALWDLARAIVVGGRPGDLNQALMELGALVCTPADPSCERCPVRSECRAREEGRERELPFAKAKARPSRVKLVALLASDSSGSLLLAKRSMDGLFGGLWEPPMVEQSLREESSTPSWLRNALATSTIVGSVEHVLTHRILEVSVVRSSGAAISTLAPPAHGYVEACFMRVEKSLGVSRLARKVLAFVDAPMSAPLDAPRDRAPSVAKQRGAPKAKKRVVSTRKPG